MQVSKHVTMFVLYPSDQVSIRDHVNVQFKFNTLNVKCILTKCHCLGYSGSLKMIDRFDRLRVFSRENHRTWGWDARESSATPTEPTLVFTEHSKKWPRSSPI